MAKLFTLAFNNLEVVVHSPNHARHLRPKCEVIGGKIRGGLRRKAGFASLCRLAGCMVELEPHIRNMAVESGPYLEAQSQRLTLPPNPPGRQGVELADVIPSLDDAVARQAPYMPRIARICGQFMDRESRADIRVLGPAFLRENATDVTIRSPCTLTVIKAFIRALFGRRTKGSAWEVVCGSFMQGQELDKEGVYHKMITLAVRNASLGDDDADVKRLLRSDPLGCLGVQFVPAVADTFMHVGKKWKRMMMQLGEQKAALECESLPSPPTDQYVKALALKKYKAIRAEMVVMLARSVASSFPFSQEFLDSGESGSGDSGSGQAGAGSVLGRRGRATKGRKTFRQRGRVSVS